MTSPGPYVLVLFVRDTTEMAERHGRILAELAELGMSAARAVHGDLMAAEEPQVRAELGLTFQRLSRSVRQSLALEAKLARDERARAERAAQAALSHRKSRLKTAVEPLVWTEAEDDETAETRLTALGDFLDALSLDDDFLDGPIEAQIARICAAFGVPRPANESASRSEGADLPERRSSA